MKKLILVVAVLTLASCKVRQTNHTGCKNKDNCPHTNKRYYIENKKNRNIFW